MPSTTTYDNTIYGRQELVKILNELTSSLRFQIPLSEDKQGEIRTEDLAFVWAVVPNRDIPNTCLINLRVHSTRVIDASTGKVAMMYLFDEKHLLARSTLLFCNLSKHEAQVTAHFIPEGVYSIEFAVD